VTHSSELDRLLHRAGAAPPSMTRLDRLTITEVSGVDRPANELDGWMVAKAAGGVTVLDVVKAVLSKADLGLKVKSSPARNAVLDTCDRLRKSCRNDDLFVGLISGRSILFHGSKVSGVLKAAARHDGRKHPDTGRFTPMAEPKHTKVEGIVWTHGDTRRRIPWVLDGGKTPTAPDSTEPPTTPYDGEPGDRAGAVPTPSTAEGLRARTLT
jgi:hypothetical protein